MMRFQDIQRFCLLGVLFSSPLFSSWSVAGEVSAQDPKPRKAVVVEGSDFTVYQSDSVKVFFSSAFLGEMSDVDPSEYNRLFRKIFDLLFKQGQLTGEMFYREFVNIPPGVININQKEIERLNSAGGVDEALRSSTGPLIQILYFFPSDVQPEEKNQKAYEFWITFDNMGVDPFHKFLVTIETH